MALCVQHLEFAPSQNTEYSNGGGRQQVTVLGIFPGISPFYRPFSRNNGLKSYGNLWPNPKGSLESIFGYKKRVVMV